MKHNANIIVKQTTITALCIYECYLSDNHLCIVFHIKLTCKYIYIYKIHMYTHACVHMYTLNTHNNIMTSDAHSLNASTIATSERMEKTSGLTMHFLARYNGPNYVRPYWDDTGQPFTCSCNRQLQVQL